tara:strand:+ start:564 stop:683 length:120 start_codon:yes stop_codon:yes gene_type:complete
MALVMHFGGLPFAYDADACLAQPRLTPTLHNDDIEKPPN